MSLCLEADRAAARSLECCALLPPLTAAADAAGLNLTALLGFDSSVDSAPPSASRVASVPERRTLARQSNSAAIE